MRATTVAYYSPDTGAVTMHYPSQVRDRYPDATMIHEVVHSELTTESTIGILEQILCQAIRADAVHGSLRHSMREFLGQLLGSTFVVHEGIATYIGLEAASQNSVEAVPFLLSQLPEAYLNALEPVLRIFPKPDGSSSALSACSYFLLLGFGRFALELPAIQTITRELPGTWNELAGLFFSPSPDDRFCELLRYLSEGRHIGDLVDIIRLELRPLLDVSSPEWHVEMLSRAAERDEEFFQFQKRLATRLSQHLATLRPDLGRHVTVDDRLERLSEFFDACNLRFRAPDGSPPFPGVRLKKHAGPMQPVTRIAPVSGEPSELGPPYLDVPPQQAVRNISKTLLNRSMNADVVTLRIQVRPVFNPKDHEIVASPRLTVPAKHWFVTFDTYIDDSPRGDLPSIDVARQLKHACGGRYAALLTSTDFGRVIKTANADIIVWHLDQTHLTLASDEGLNPEGWIGLMLVGFENDSADTYVHAVAEAAKKSDITAFALTVFRGKLVVLICRPAGRSWFLWKTLTPVDASFTLRKLESAAAVRLVTDRSALASAKIDINLLYKSLVWHYRDWSGVDPEGGP